MFWETSGATHGVLVVNLGTCSDRLGGLRMKLCTHMIVGIPGDWVVGFKMF